MTEAMIVSALNGVTQSEVVDDQMLAGKLTLHLAPGGGGAKLTAGSLSACGLPAVSHQCRRIA